jgi:putative transcriptional regulator
MKNNLRVHRAIHSITQEDLAKKIGVSRQTINAIEKGKYNPSLVVGLNISRVLNTRIEEIFELEASDRLPD